MRGGSSALVSHSSLNVHPSVCQAPRQNNQDDFLVPEGRVGRLILIKLAELKIHSATGCGYRPPELL